MCRGQTSPTFFYCTRRGNIVAEKNNSICSICGRSYNVCFACKDSIQLHPYKTFTDTAEHYKVFQVVRGFSTGVYTKEEARERFKNIDLQDLEDYRPHIKQIIKDILKEDFVSDAFESDKNLATEKAAISRKRKYKTAAE